MIWWDLTTNISRKKKNSFSLKKPLRNRKKAQYWRYKHCKKSRKLNCKNKKTLWLKIILNKYKRCSRNSNQSLKEIPSKSLSLNMIYKGANNQVYSSNRKWSLLKNKRSNYLNIISKYVNNSQRSRNLKNIKKLINLILKDNKNWSRNISKRWELKKRKYAN